MVENMLKYSWNFNQRHCSYIYASPFASSIAFFLCWLQLSKPSLQHLLQNLCLHNLFDLLAQPSVVQLTLSNLCTILYPPQIRISPLQQMTARAVRTCLVKRKALRMVAPTEKKKLEETRRKRKMEIQKRRKNDNKAKIGNHHRKERAMKKAAF